MKNQRIPDINLFSQGIRESGGVHERGRWHFKIETADGKYLLEASDEEPFTGERLELMAVIRGLEALNQPSRVNLITSSHQISRGFRLGMKAWRENDWTWERFGKVVPVNNVDLWKRIDHAMRFHIVNCRVWRFDTAHATATSPRQPIGLAAKESAARLVDRLMSPLKNLGRTVSAPSMATDSLKLLWGIW